MVFLDFVAVAAGAFFCFLAGAVEEVALRLEDREEVLAAFLFLAAGALDLGAVFFLEAFATIFFLEAFATIFFLEAFATLFFLLALETGAFLAVVAFAVRVPRAAGLEALCLLTAGAFFLEGLLVLLMRRLEEDADDDELLFAVRFRLFGVVAPGFFLETSSVFFTVNFAASLVAARVHGCKKKNN